MWSGGFSKLRIKTICCKEFTLSCPNQFSCYQKQLHCKLLPRDPFCVSVTPSQVYHYAHTCMVYLIILSIHPEENVLETSSMCTSVVWSQCQRKKRTLTELSALILWTRSNCNDRLKENGTSFTVKIPSILLTKMSTYNQAMQSQNLQWWDKNVTL